MVINLKTHLRPAAMPSHREQPHFCSKPFIIVQLRRTTHILRISMSPRILICRKRWTELADVPAAAHGIAADHAASPGRAACRTTQLAALFKRTEFFLAVMIFNVPSRVHDTVLKMIYILRRYIY